MSLLVIEFKVGKDGVLVSLPCGFSSRRLHVFLLFIAADLTRYTVELNAIIADTEAIATKSSGIVVAFKIAKLTG
ncbi:hypothetical protein [Wolbachia endosymbiont (group B) of Gerris lacustris]|uniref:hypothetical protein n=1 Tax=Wolbachia endosymbiont (group B) of Gerris lacustris TaxID=3066159 RepID=UPI003340E6C2